MLFVEGFYHKPGTKQQVLHIQGTLIHPGKIKECLFLGICLFPPCIIFVSS